MLQLKISIQENCNSLYLFECTGKYDRSCNSTGWGGLNGQVRNASKAYYEIYPPGSTEPLTYELPGDFPSECKLGYELFPHNLGMEVFESGVWRFDYFVLMDDQTLHQVSCTSFLIKDLDCCIASKMLSVDTNNFELEEISSVNNLFALLESAKQHACLGNIDKLKEIVNYLYAKCRCNCG